jgi:hypothetical protein
MTNSKHHKDGYTRRERGGDQKIRCVNQGERRKGAGKGYRWGTYLDRGCRTHRIPIGGAGDTKRGDRCGP